MHLSNLITLFNRSLCWNAVLYFLYKTLFTLVTFLLFNRLSTHDFAVWANINSIIFLLLLWFDCGLRKSIPRYCTEFERNGSLNSFLRYILTVHSIILIIAVPFFLLAITVFLKSLSLLCHPALLYISSAIFFTEGINSSITLFYHAHFWNKTHTIIQSSTLLLEMSINIIFILNLKIGIDLLFALFLTKLVASIITVTVTLFILKKRYNHTSPTKMIELLPQARNFIKHSAAMWFGTTMKSLTERNFLVPFITHSLGLGQANLFKVANDWAMLIHRPIIKTIGSSDTALLSHVEASKHSSDSSTTIVNYLLKKILLICLPFFVLMLFVSYYVTQNRTILILFCVITIGHLFETIFSPYERLLEVKQQYKFLIFSYLPYLITVPGIAIYSFLFEAHLTLLLLLIHSIRLSCSIIMVYYAHKYFFMNKTSIKPAKSLFHYPSPEITKPLHEKN